jgi:pimeloyl-ACP methyl ester carboxylesterase
MTHGMLAVGVALAMSGASARGVAQAAGLAGTPLDSGHVLVNGLRMYYERHGSTGTPLVLIHGGGSTIGTTFGRLLPLFAATHRVIAVEVQAHGHTPDVDRPFTFEQDADDVAALLDSLKVAPADVFGFSNGGTTALQVAIRHPRHVRRLVVASANYSRDGMQEGFWDLMAEGTFADMPQLYKDAYLKITASEAGLHAMYERDSKRMLAFRDIPDAALRSIEAPALVTVGDRDVVRVEHALALSRLLPHGRLCVLPGGHGEYFGEIGFHASDRVVRAFADLVEEFLAV